MSGKTTLKTALATVAVALVAGVSLQIAGAGSAERERTVVSRYSSDVISTMTVNNAKSDSIFGVPNVVVTPLSHLENVQTVAAIPASHPDRAVPTMGIIQAAPTGDCQTTLTATPAIAAMVHLNVSAACHRNAFFVVRHMGLVFSGKTDSTGTARISAPALAVDAHFAVSFENLEVASVALRVPDLVFYDRAVLQWRGQDNLQLHALEFGAKIGDPGHVWFAAASSPERALAGERGFIKRLGLAAADMPYMAEVYTVPSGLMNRGGAVSLYVGALVTERNCNRTVDAHAIQTTAGRMLSSRDLYIPLPSCDAQGRSLLMPNMFEDVVLAAR